MLSRHAESLFWTGRYVERASDTARMLDVYVHYMLEDPDADEDDEDDEGHSDERPQGEERPPSEILAHACGPLHPHSRPAGFGGSG